MFKKSTLIRFFRFGITGLLTTILHTVIAYFVYNFIIQISAVANGVGFTCSTLFSYLVNAKWSFNSPITRKNMKRYIIVCLGGFLITLTISMISDYMKYSYLLSIAMVVVVVPPLSFLFHNFWTFRKRQ